METKYRIKAQPVYHGLAGAYGTWFRLLKASWHCAAASIVSQTLTAVAAALAGRGLGASSYGSVIAIVAYYGWFSLMSNYWTYALLPSYLADQSAGEADRKSACVTSLLLTTVLTILAVLIAYLTMPVFVPGITRGPLHKVALLYALVFTFSQLRVALDMISQSAGWLRLWSASNIVGTALPVMFLLLYLALCGKLAPYSYMVLLVAATALGTAFSFVVFVLMLGGLRCLRARASLVVPFLAAGRGPWLGIFSNVLGTFGVKTLIAGNLPSRELGLYEIVMTFHMWVSSAGMAVIVPALSEWSRMAADRDFDGLRKDVRARQTSTAVILGTVMVLVMVAAKPILLCIYGPEFGDATLLLRIFALMWPLGGLGGWYWAATFALAQPWRLARPNLIYSIPVFFAVWALLRLTSLGVVGVGLAVLVGSLAWLIDWEYQFRQALRQAVRDVDE